MNELILTKESTESEIKTYFMKQVDGFVESIFNGSFQKELEENRKNEVTCQMDLREILKPFEPLLRKRRNPSKTYLMCDKGSGLYKIGKAVDVCDRFISLKSMCPLIVLIANCDKNIETLLHKKFSDKRKSGEWFCLSDLDVQYIKDEFRKND